MTDFLICVKTFPELQNILTFVGNTDIKIGYYDLQSNQRDHIVVYVELIKF